ncbi:MAG: translation initiation factor [Bacteroidota bacterium]|jgi:translation initiation factor 1|nr:translation initiation factor [Bacteroidota bacterium]
MSKKKLYNTNGIVYSTNSDFNYSEEKNSRETLPPNEQLLKIKLDKKHRGGKVVTIIEGFAMGESAIGSMSKQLKTFCGSGGSAKNNEIIIQGDHKEKIWQWLIKNGYIKSKKI